MEEIIMDAIQRNTEENEVNGITIKEITKHALERFVERTMDKNGSTDIKQYINKNIDLIDERIKKFFNSSSFLYEGTMREHGRTRFFINKHGWIFILDKTIDRLVTVYKVDLHAGDDLNVQFTKIINEKINLIKEELKDLIKQRNDENTQLRCKVQDNVDKIKEYKKLIKTLEDENESTLKYVKDNQNSVSVKEYELKEAIENLICTKVF